MTEQRGSAPLASANPVGDDHFRSVILIVPDSVTQQANPRPSAQRVGEFRYGRLAAQSVQAPGAARGTLPDG
ncbi:hypothetical protein P3H15_31105, partial [Rhodococcus sp. T2V]|uniref:hypothetical protein n=1 Tax=Rhodococcus sp. T2V TaxID=3034164 RepID=UPI0023E1D081